MKRRPVLTPASLLLAACSIGCRTPEATDLDRTGLAATLETRLRDNLAEAWYPRVIDREHGGYLSDFDAAWRPTGPDRKMIVSQARHVWTTARLSEALGDETYLEYAGHGFAFLRDVLWDETNGGFFWLVDREGRPLADGNGWLTKQAYGQAFAIYGLAAYFEVSGDSTALALAVRAFEWVDRHGHDSENGGYFNYLTRDGRVFRDGYADGPNSQRTPSKDQNSSIHLLEAFTELHRIWPDERVEERLRELLVLIRDRIVVDPGYLTLFHEADWTPVSWRDSTEAARRANFYFDHVSFGHDVETAYLMLEAEETLRGHASERTWHRARQMVDHALHHGWDSENGGFIEGGYYPAGADEPVRVDETKNWWAQAEGLNTLLIVADRYPADEQDYIAYFGAQWDYIDTYLVDHERGGWFAGGLDRQPELRDGPKAFVWKAAYHDARALMNVMARLRTKP